MAKRVLRETANIKKYILRAIKEINFKSHNHQRLEGKRHYEEESVKELVR